MSIEAPLVCICIPTYNAAETIKETLTSVLDQTYENLKILVVDNASTDETLSIVKSFDDGRIMIHKGPVNVGAEGNFQLCIDLAFGQYTAIYHADDLYEPDMVKSQVAFLERHSNLGAVFCQANLIDEKNKRIGHILIPKALKNCDAVYEFPEVFKAVMKYSNFFVCPSAMLRTEIYQREIKTWRGDLFKTSSDLDVWFRVLQKHAVGILPARLINYRISMIQHSARLRARIKRSDFFLVMEHYLAKPEVQSLLSEQDYLNYERLERTDLVLRAVNLYLIGDIKAARALCINAPVYDVIKAALTSRRGLMTGMAFFFLRLLIVLNLPRLGQWILTKMKSVVRK